MQTWQVALLVVSSIFVGIWIPVSLQLVATLRASRRVLAEVEEVAHAAAQIKDSVRVMSSIGAAVGPAVVALVRALREPKPESEDQPRGGNGVGRDGGSNTSTQDRKRVSHERTGNE